MPVDYTRRLWPEIAIFGKPYDGRLMVKVDKLWQISRLRQLVDNQVLEHSKAVASQPHLPGFESDRRVVDSTERDPGVTIAHPCFLGLLEAFWRNRGHFVWATLPLPDFVAGNLQH